MNTVKKTVKGSKNRGRRGRRNTMSGRGGVRTKKSREGIDINRVQVRTKNGTWKNTVTKAKGENE